MAARSSVLDRGRSRELSCSYICSRSGFIIVVPSVKYVGLLLSTSAMVTVA